jgi:hypothetical protein
MFSWNKFSSNGKYNEKKVASLSSWMKVKTTIMLMVRGG